MYGYELFDDLLAEGYQTVWFYANAGQCQLLDEFGGELARRRTLNDKNSWRLTGLPQGPYLPALPPNALPLSLSTQSGTRFTFMLIEP